MKKYVTLFIILGGLGSILVLLMGDIFNIIGYFLLYLIITLALISYSYQENLVEKKKSSFQLLFTPNHPYDQK